jgi:hypothetical protein
MNDPSLTGGIELDNLWFTYRVRFRGGSRLIALPPLVQADTGLEVTDASVSCSFHWKP